MSATGVEKRITPPDIRARKGGTPLVMLTAYTWPMARIVDRHCDMALVGDSLGMVVHGMPSTLPVTLDMMILHAQAVARGLEHAMMVVDLPFGTYEDSCEQAFRSAARVMSETGASAVKLEGGQHMADTVSFLTQRGIPVMGHVGLLPQAVHTVGGYRVQGRGKDAARVKKDAMAVANAGAFAVVLEKVPATLARDITKAISVPTIGIGASADCDGQVLVTDDMLGLFTSFLPKFVKRYADLGQLADQAISDYAADVRARRFPAAEHLFSATPPQKK
ncbi:MAG: 3-methyl-2-oxobutanoate hydroxymethyltransferase [Paracoccaceae bacterium]